MGGWRKAGGAAIGCWLSLICIPLAFLLCYAVYYLIWSF